MPYVHNVGKFDYSAGRLNIRRGYCAKVTDEQFKYLEETYPGQFVPIAHDLVIAYGEQIDGEFDPQDALLNLSRKIVESSRRELAEINRKVEDYRNSLLDQLKSNAQEIVTTSLYEQAPQAILDIAAQVGVLEKDKGSDASEEAVEGEDRQDTENEEDKKSRRKNFKVKA